MDDYAATISILLVNSLGLHARPSVKLTKLAKTFASRIEIAASAEGPWVDAKSIVKVMAIKAAKGAVLHFRATGDDARDALAALSDLVALDFHEAADDHGEPAAGHAD